MIALLLAVVGFFPAADERIPVVLSTDCGADIDDQWALTHLALSPRIDLRGVVTTHAPDHPSEKTAKNAREILASLHLAKTPTVIAGSTVPLADRKTPRLNPGVEFILRESRAGTPERRVVIVAIGAATDVASALLVDPTLADRVEIVSMGFLAWPNGGEEYNIKNDIKAWQVLLDSTVPLVVGDQAVCKKDLVMTSEGARSRLEKGGPAAQPLIELLDRWLRDHGRDGAALSGSPDAWLIWDEVTVAHLLGLAESRTVPRPVLRDDFTFDVSRPKGTIKWVTSVRSDPFWADLATCLKQVR